MKLYLVYYPTNYNMGVTIVKCINEEELKVICTNSKTIWDHYEFIELDLTNFPNQETPIYI